MIFSGRAGIYELSSDIRLRMERADELRKARGKLSQAILREISSKFIITVGDRVLRSAILSGFIPNVCIFDMMEERNFIGPPEGISGFLLLRTRNERGTISKDAWASVRDAIIIASRGIRTALLVEGEEDLLGFPSVIMAPEGSYVLYGQPKEGIVHVLVTDDVKNEAIKLFYELFEVI
jgi:hypothetical protein